MHHAQHAMDRTHAAPAREHDATDGFAIWIALWAALMIAAMSFLAGANFIGDRLERTPIAWNETE